MEIFLQTSRAQQRCPLCQDDLPLDPTSWLRCGSCGTGYHPECESLSPRCALLGCPGSLGLSEASVSRRFALVLNPSEYSPDQIHAVADRLGLDLYDAGLRLRSRQPSVLAYCSEQELAQHQLALRSAEVYTLGVDALRLSQSPREVVSIERFERALTLHSEDGCSYRLPLSAPPFVVLGRYEYFKRVRDKSAPVSRQVTRARDSTEFIHVYHDEGSEPFALTSDTIRDYQFLGADMSVSGSRNFRALTELLCQGARVVKTLSGLEGKLVSRRKSSTVHQSSNRAWAVASSHLLWLVDRSASQAKHSRGP